MQPFSKGDLSDLLLIKFKISGGGTPKIGDPDFILVTVTGGKGVIEILTYSNGQKIE